jgi:hypothetical protein
MILAVMRDLGLCSSYRLVGVGRGCGVDSAQCLESGRSNKNRS